MLTATARKTERAQASTLSRMDAGRSVRSIAARFKAAREGLDAEERREVARVLPGVVSLVGKKVFGLPESAVVLASGKVGQMFFVVSQETENGRAPSLILRSGTALDLKPVSFRTASSTGDLDGSTTVTSIETAKGRFIFKDLQGGGERDNCYLSFQTERYSKIVRFL